MHAAVKEKINLTISFQWQNYLKNKRRSSCLLKVLRFEHTEMIYNSRITCGKLQFLNICILYIFVQKF